MWSKPTPARYTKTASWVSPMATRSSCSWRAVRGSKCGPPKSIRIDLRLTTAVIGHHQREAIVDLRPSNGLPYHRRAHDLIENLFQPVVRLVYRNRLLSLGQRRPRRRDGLSKVSRRAASAGTLTSICEIDPLTFPMTAPCLAFSTSADAMPITRQNKCVQPTFSLTGTSSAPTLAHASYFSAVRLGLDNTEDEGSQCFP